MSAIECQVHHLHRHAPTECQVRYVGHQVSNRKTCQLCQVCWLSVGEVLGTDIDRVPGSMWGGADSVPGLLFDTSVPPLSSSSCQRVKSLAALQSAARVELPDARSTPLNEAEILSGN